MATTVKALIYGEPGIGKTTLGLSAPRPLLIDCDGGVRRVEPQFRSDYVGVSSWKDILEVVSDPLKDYDTVVVDTVGKAMDFLIEEIKKQNYKLVSRTGGLTLQGWGALLSQFSQFLSGIQTKGKNLVFVAHHREGMEDEKRYFRPDIAGRTLGNIIRDMDLVGYMQSRNNYRTISFNPTDAFYGKNSCNLPDIIDIPDLHKTASKPLTEIFNSFEEMLESQGELSEKYYALIDTIEAKVKAIKTAKQANEFVAWIKDEPEIWDSRVVGRGFLQNKVKSLGLKYNKEAGEYEEAEKKGKPKAEKKEAKDEKGK